MRDIKLIFFIFLLYGFTGCINNDQKITIAPYELLHDNSSKVWILDSQYENNIDRTPYNRLDKWVITFYSDQSFVLTTLGHFADYSLHQGDFSFNDGNSKIIFEWKSGQIDENQIELIDRTNLIYTIDQGENVEVKMHFIPMDKMPVPLSIDLDDSY
tara:strand:+ start:464 stop:934 length:471 start_codon:yes stop_codon:yes gene_type:complete